MTTGKPTYVTWLRVFDEGDGSRSGYVVGGLHDPLALLVPIKWPRGRPKPARGTSGYLDRKRGTIHSSLFPLAL